MPWYERRIKAGRTLELERYYSLRPKGINLYRRGSKQSVTSERQKKINALHAKRRAVRLVNNNFGPGDLFLSPTYERRPPRTDQAKKEVAAYLRRLRDWRRRNGYSDLKYFAATEDEATRPHHHIIVNDMPADVVMHLWQYDLQGNRIPGHGRCPVDRLDNSGDYAFVARYIAKDDKTGRHRYTHSRNLTAPEVEERQITRSTGSIKRGIRWPKGYKVVDERLSASEEGNEYYYARAAKWEADG